MDKDYIIALAGNPNVGKSTVFNTLTGLKQHTGNWPGKTVSNASGECIYGNQKYIFYDLPGTYSLIAHSREEEVARDFICFGSHDACVIVCDAVCLERNLNLVLQTLEITNNVVICVNLLDEAAKKKIKINLKELSNLLGVPVVGTSARSNKGLDELMENVKNVCDNRINTNYTLNYDEKLETAINMVENVLKYKNIDIVNSRWLALRLIDYDNVLINSLEKCQGFKITEDEELITIVKEARKYLYDSGIELEDLKEIIVSSISKEAEEIANKVVIFEKKDYASRDRKIDKILTSKITGIPIMIMLFLFIFWLTIVGANYPSEILFNVLFWFQEKLVIFFNWLHLPSALISLLSDGIYKVLAWVVAVMLPPMAIFFPLFTLLEDLGYLPRIAFNLDKYFKKCKACGKQALTMAMGFGCNAVGVTGARIIDSPRERLIAIITNNLVPCNGRFPTIISIITMFFIGFNTGFTNSLFSALILGVVIIFGILMTFLVSKFLSKTLLKGVPSSFTLELPPYRKPQVGKVIVRSIFDRTLFVLGRAITIAIPAGALIWLLANINIGSVSLLTHMSNFLDPFAKIIGLDGIILVAFILGFPANEIVVPIMIMGYMMTGSIMEFDSLVELKALLVNNGWTITTAVCFIIFSLIHFPCSTTCLTIKKETGSIKWTLVSFLLPTILGIIICFVVSNILGIFI